MHRFLIPSFALAAALTAAACGVDPTVVDNAAAGIQPADGVEAPAEQVVTGRVVRVDRDGPSVEIVESFIVTGTDATDAARAAGVIGPDEEWLRTAGSARCGTS